MTQKRTFLKVVLFIFFVLFVPSTTHAAQAQRSSLQENRLEKGAVHLIRGEANALFFAPRGWKIDPDAKKNNLYVGYYKKVSKDTIPTFLYLDDALIRHQSELDDIKTWDDFLKKELPRIKADNEYQKTIDESFEIDGVTGVRVEYGGADPITQIYFSKFGKIYVLHLQVDSKSWKNKKVRESIEQSINTLSVRRTSIQSHKK